MARIDSVVLVFFLCFIIQLYIGEHAARCQLILAPSKFRLGKAENKFLLISPRSVIAQLSLSSHKNFHGIDLPFEFLPNVITDLNLSQEHIAKALKIQKHSKIYAKLNVDGQVVTEEFEIEDNDLLYFQTDKSIYRTTETVRFRILRVSKTLLPIEDNCYITIRNHQLIKLDYAKLSLKPPYYIADYSFDLPLIAQEGTWSAQADCGTKLSKNLNFEVKEYVLTGMKIDIDVPRIQLCSNRIFPIVLNVSYTYDKPIEGTVFFTIGRIRDNKIETKLLTTSTYCLENGSLRSTEYYDFCQDLYSTRSLRISVEATVTDLKTHQKEKKKVNHTILTSSPYIISNRGSKEHYKPKLVNYITLEVLNKFDQSEPNLAIPVRVEEIMSRYGDRINPLEVQSKNGVTIVAFKVSQIMGELTFEAKADIPEYHQKIRQNFTLYPFDENEKSFVLISNRKLFYKAGERFHSPVQVSGNIDTKHLYYVVSSKGAIFKFGTVNSGHIDMPITNRMMPSARILVLALDQNNNILSDSIKIFVEQNDCGVQIGTDSVFVPGSNVTFRLLGRKNDCIALNAVDEAVYLLKKSHNLENIQEDLNQSDLGNGSGDGFNSMEIISNAGFKILNLNRKINRPDRGKRQAGFHRCDSQNPINKTHYCCYLALKQTPKPENPESCKELELIVAPYSLQREECAKHFLNCCLHRLCMQEERVEPSYVDSQKSSPDRGSTTALHNTNNARKNSDFDHKITEYIRSNFRDNWIFDLVLMNEEEQNYTATAPHSITSWTISSFSVSTTDGLCFQPDKRITVFKPFFVQVLMPEYVVLEEQTEIRTIVFNYLDEQLMATIYFYDVEGICSDASKENERTDTKMIIEPGSSSFKAFPIIPIRVDIFTIRIEIEAMDSSGHRYRDVVLKNLTVLHPGITKRLSRSLDLDPTNRARRETQISDNAMNAEIISTIYPENYEQKIKIVLNEIEEQIVPGTVRHQLSLTGQRFNPSIKSIEELNYLIQKPKGCGEQNIFYMAFNLYTMMYLDRSGKLNTTTELKGIKYLKRALRQQYQYRKDDGSFSAFLNRGSSVWLTAFATKVFCQSQPFLKKKLDDMVIKDALIWLKKQQNQTYGSWHDQFPIRYQQAGGGALKGIDTLTASVLICLNECHQYLGPEYFEQVDLKKTMEKAKKYLLDKTKPTFIEDSYSLSIITYSLSYQNQNYMIMRDLLYKLMHHPHKKLDHRNNHLYFENDHPIETTAYVLLSLTKFRKFISPMPIFAANISNWLIAQPSSPTFDNTQATIVALEALAEYHAILSSDNKHDDQYRLYANVSFNSRHKRSIEFNWENMDLIHTIPVDGDANNIDIVTSGDGFGKVEFLTYYNVYPPDGNQCKFWINVELKAVKECPFQSERFDAEAFFSNESRQIVEKKLNIKRKHRESNNGDLMCNKIKKDGEHYRTKRGVWSRIWGPKKRNKPDLTAIEPDDNMDDCDSFEDVPTTDMDKPAVRRLEICFRRVNENKGMVILEANLLSGYKVIAQDLFKLKQDPKKFIEYYEMVDSKIIFYFIHVPTAINNCLKFRLYQAKDIIDIQSALVQVYDYYKKANPCTRLYSDVSIPNNLNYTCDSRTVPFEMGKRWNTTCYCKLEIMCPRTIIKEFKEKYVSSHWEALELYRKKVCNTYQIVIIGRVAGKQCHPSGQNCDFYNVDIDILEPIKIDFYNRTIPIRLHNGCDISNIFRIGARVFLMMIRYDVSEKYTLLDGHSILEPYDHYVIGELETRMKLHPCV